MKKIAMVFSGIIMVLGCFSLAASLLLEAVLTNVFLVYLTAKPISFSHDILNPDVTKLNIFSAIAIISGFAGMLYLAIKNKE